MWNISTLLATLSTVFHTTLHCIIASTASCILEKQEVTFSFFSLAHPLSIPYGKRQASTGMKHLNLTNYICSPKQMYL
ncbi:hypothetical protein HMPREF9446_01329 [Bacteroides fluxus YIT 12057]|uniref:Uncharacterized protein n=1 Tax=Bacteroides fluxus YIT 12057 TaxID=763034 RepID=F3PRH8_9BACE|nr:hypothetical protein HMPREF9446_01329 [Bacteroides fluxus YIT 12057]